MRLLGATFVRLNNLHKGFILFNHSQVRTGFFLDGRQPVLEVFHFRFQRQIALQQAGILCLLLADLVLQSQHIENAGITKPERVLQQQDYKNERENENAFAPLHGSAAGQHGEGVKTRVTGVLAQRLFDTQQLVIFGDTIRTGQ